MFSICNLDHQLIGACGLCHIDWVQRNADFSIYIGYNNLYIDEEYAIDAGKTIIQYGFMKMNLHRLCVEIYDFDERKKRMFEHLGFELDGRHKHTQMLNGKWHDSLFYGLISDH